jgi:hypothetical protein
MKSILFLLLSLVIVKASEKTLKYDFGNTSGKIQDWVLISDIIMGGISKAMIKYTDNSVIMKGDISLDNFGGFASVKTRFKAIDLSTFSGINIRYKALNQQFAFTLEETQNWTRPNYKKEFTSNKQDTWEIATIYLKDFKEYVIGEATGEYINLSSRKNILRMGIISTDKREGPFSLEIDYIEFFR